jgi:hypothetical protein
MIEVANNLGFFFSIASTRARQNRPSPELVGLHPAGGRATRRQPLRHRRRVIPQLGGDLFRRQARQPATSITSMNSP